MAVSFIEMFLGVAVILIMITGLFLIYRAIALKMYNVILLGLTFTLFSVAGMASLDLTYILMIISYFCIIFFVKVTFYQEKSSNFTKILILTIILAAITGGLSYYVQHFTDLEVRNLNPVTYIAAAVDWSLVILTYGWMGLSSLKLYRETKDQDIEDWVKKRMKIVGYASLIFPLFHIPNFFLIATNYPRGSADVFGLIGWIGLIIVFLIYGVSMLLSWIMPSFFKEFLNRDYRYVDIEDIPEEELLSIFGGV